jgi:hypothetical protein
MKIFPYDPLLETSGEKIFFSGVFFCQEALFFFLALYLKYYSAIFHLSFKAFMVMADAMVFSHDVMAVLLRNQ